MLSAAIFTSCSFFFVSEKIPHRYAARRTIAGTIDSLQHVYDDRCCSGANDVSKHFTVDIFDGVKRRPLADAFHMTQVQ